MSYEFPPDIKLLIDQQMATGMYASEDQVLQAALSVLSDYHATVAEVRQGRNEYEQGLAEPLSQAMGDLRQQLGFTQ
jgi:Arc/MetJ-type ribon-helix-helix transcriptional regulator